MARTKLPPLASVTGDLWTDRRAFGTLLAGAAALFAVGIDPRVWGPTLSTTQAAIRAQPDLESVIFVVGVLSAIMLLVGGAVGDLSRPRPLIRGGLVVMLGAAVFGLLLPESPLLVPSRVVAVIAESFVFPVALASVAMAYSGIARATAIGLAYGAYGGGQALMPILLTVIPGQRWPGFVAAVVASGFALWVTWRRVPDLPKVQVRDRSYVLGTAAWAGGAVSLITGLLWLGGGWDNPPRLVMIGGGIALLVGFLLWERRRREEHPESVRIERRPVTVALYVGVTIAIAQAAPMLQLPQYFSIVQGYGPLFGVVALAPLFLALVAAGPVAGSLLIRFSPRVLVAGGVTAIGVGNLVLAALLSGRGANYLVFVLPLIAVGAGFVIATTVRTAIIFSSVPRGLPATAAALNEASIGVGMRIGIVLTSAIVATVALASLDASLAGTAPDAAASARATFEQLLAVIGLPSFASVAQAVKPDEAGLYVDAYLVGIRASLVLSGLAAVVGGGVAWLLLGRRDPLRTMWEHRDERETESAAAPATTA